MDPMKKEKKIGFFKRLKIAIFNLEEYGMFLAESFWKAFKFFAILMLLIVLCMTFAYHYSLSNTILSYIRNEMPEMSFTDGVLKSEQKVDAYDEKYNFRMFVNTDETVSEETMKEYEEKVGLTEIAVIFLKDKAYVCAYALKDGVNLMDTSISEDELYEFSKQEMEYKVLLGSYPEFKFSGKEEFETIVEEDVIPAVTASTFFPVACAVYVSEFFQMFGDVCVVALIGYVAAMFLGVRFKLSPMLALAIYSLSLSFVLKGAYSTANIATGLYIEYFDVVYLVIGYIYIIAAIFMIKYDLIKQKEELQKILEVQEKVKKELEEENKEVKPEEKTEEESPVENQENEVSETENNKEKQEEKEPDGSEI